MHKNGLVNVIDAIMSHLYCIFLNFLATFASEKQLIIPVIGAVKHFDKIATIFAHPNLS